MLRCLVITALVLCAVVAHAQSTGTIGGFVTDPSGAAVPDATVTATLVSQNASRTATTGTDGSYVFNAMTPGVYRVSVEKTGFQQLIQSDVVLATNQNLRLDLSVRIGQIAETVEVSGVAPLVDTRSPALASLVDDRRVVDLPLNGRNVINLAATLPGIVSVSAPQQLTDARSGPVMNVNGSTATQNLFTFNGGIFINPSRNTGMNYPPPDALQEFSIQTQSFTAEYGRNAGSQVNVVSRSGTNEFHGSLWEFHRNDNLNARNFFASRRSAQVQNQFGGAAGGPVVRDKVFVFGSYQGLRDRREAVTQTVDVPSPAERIGDFRGLGRNLTNPTDTLTGQPFTDSTGRPCVQGSVILSGCISPVAANLLKFIPEAAGNRITIFDPQPRNGDMYMGRIDWNQSSRNVVSGHIYVDRNRLDRPVLSGGNVRGYIGRFTSQQTTMASINDTFTITPAVINQSTVAFLRSTSLSDSPSTTPNEDIGIRGLPLYAESGRLQVTAGNVNFTSGGRVPFVSNNWQFRNMTSWNRGRHNLKFGGEYLHLTFLQIFLSPPRATFNGSRSGDPFADFLLGAFRDVSGGFGVRTNDDSQRAPSLFINDEWRIHPRFSLTLGLRWEPMFPWVDKYDRLTSLAAIGTDARSARFPDAPPGFLFAGDPGVPRGISPSDLNNVAPRFGFAWDALGNGRLSVRGAYGIFYDSLKADSVSQEGAPWAGNFQVFNGRIEDPFGSLGLTAPPLLPATEGFGCVNSPAFPGVSCSRFPLPISGLFLASDLKTPYVQSWNLTVERQLTRDIMLQTSYVGKTGIKLDYWRNFNPALYRNDPVTGAPPSLQNVNNRVGIAPGLLAPNVTLLETSGRSWYNGWQTQVVKRFAHGVSFNANYTWSKSIDLGSTNIFARRLDNPLSQRENKGLSDFDRRHVFVASWLWSPTVNFSNRLATGVLGGWTFTGIHTAQSGSPFTIRMGDDVAQDGSGSRQRAMLRPDAGPVEISHSSRADMVARFFNTDAFVPTNQVPRGVYGNIGRNTVTGPGFANTDFSAMKDFRLFEATRLQFRAEFFNLFNQVSFGCRETTGGCNDPDANVNSRTFGQIRSAGPAREVQLALKLIW